MRLHPLAHILLALGLLSGCTGGDKADDTAAGSTQTIPDLATSTCNGMAHDWLPLEDMGGVVDWEEIEDFAMDAAGVAALMGFAGVEDTSKVQHGVRVYRVRYQTQDRGELVEATGMIAVPDTAGLTVPQALYLHPTTGLEDFCAPSGRDIIWAGVPMGLASMGYAVAAPDYLGQNGLGEEADFLHPWLLAEPTAIASLDNLRALQAFAASELDLELTDEVMVMGASQGGGAAFHVERYAPEYLPEARIIGSVAAIPTGDLVLMAELATQELTVATIAVPLALAGMREWYGVDNELDEIIPSDELERFYQAIASECPESAVPDDVQTIADAYQDSWVASVDAEDLEPWQPWSCMLAESSPATAPVRQGTGVPTFVTLGTADSVLLYESQVAGLEQYCATGHDIVAVACEGTEHAEAVQLTLDLQLEAFATLAEGGSMDGEVCGEIVVMDCAGD